MKAIDTNILARFFVNDPDDIEASRQQKIALAVLSQPVHVSLTVILEFEWVMRGFYKLSKDDIQRIFRALLGIEHIDIEHKSAVIDALDKHQQGIDFADALHVAKAKSYQSFVTFDKKLANKAHLYQGHRVVEYLQS